MILSAFISWHSIGGRVSILFYFFIQLFTIKSWISILSVGWNLLFLCPNSNHSMFYQWEPLQAISCSVDFSPSFCPSSLWQVHLVLSFPPRLKISHFSKNHWFFLVEDILYKPRSECLVCRKLLCHCF